MPQTKQQMKRGARKRKKLQQLNFMVFNGQFLHFVINTLISITTAWPLGNVCNPIEIIILYSKSVEMHIYCMHYFASTFIWIPQHSTLSTEHILEPRIICFGFCIAFLFHFDWITIWFGRNCFVFSLYLRTRWKFIALQQQNWTTINCILNGTRNG